MDCNAVNEKTGLPYASDKTVKKQDGTEVPVMHACGHDAHTTWMLGIAKIMAATKNQWKGTLIIIGQPSEEPGGGGDAMAAERYKKGVPEPDYLLGMHTAPVAVGLYLNSPGVRMAGADQFDVTFLWCGWTRIYSQCSYRSDCNGCKRYFTIPDNYQPQFRSAKCCSSDSRCCTSRY